MSELYVSCLVCGRQFQSVTNSHLRTHTLTVNEYLALYPEAPLVSPRVKQQAREHAQRINKPGVPRPGVGAKVAATKRARAEAGADYGALLRGRPKTAEHRQAISEKARASYALGSRRHWALGRTMPREERALRSRLSTGYKFTQEQSANLSRAMSANHPRGMKGKSHSLKTKIHLSQATKLAAPRIRAKMENLGRWIPAERLSEFQRYCLEVDNHTRANESKIPGYDVSKRGLCKHGTDNHQVDHILSVVDGFKASVPPEIVGSVVNLRFIHWKLNLAKFSKSDITVSELLALYSRLEKEKPPG